MERQKRATRAEFPKPRDGRCCSERLRQNDLSNLQKMSKSPEIRVCVPAYCVQKINVRFKRLLLQCRRAFLMPIDVSLTPKRRNGPVKKDKNSSEKQTAAWKRLRANGTEIGLQTVVIGAPRT